MELLMHFTVNDSTFHELIVTVESEQQAQYVMDEVDERSNNLLGGFLFEGTAHESEIVTDWG